MNMKAVVIITAAGYGKRMGKPKQFLEIAGKSMLERTISVFENTEVISEIILVVNREDIERAKKIKFSKLKQIVAGGKERQDSVFNGLKALPDDAKIVAIHDGARPFITIKIIEKAVEEAQKSGAAVVGVPVKDTIKEIKNDKSFDRALRPAQGSTEQSRGAQDKLQMTNDGRIVFKTIDRESLWAAQTPQVFKKEIILKAYEQGKDKYQVTDDSMLVEKMGVEVKMVMGSYQNLKITTPEDLKIAEGILRP
jgi:2-C-methyl-D-erythritol 4-phosphate cytidylyltransferase